MEQDPSLQARVEVIEQVLKTTAPSAEFDSILELRENLSTLAIGGLRPGEQEIMLNI